MQGVDVLNLKLEIGRAVGTLLVIPVSSLLSASISLTVNSRSVIGHNESFYSVVQSTYSTLLSARANTPS